MDNTDFLSALRLQTVLAGAVSKAQTLRELLKKLDRHAKKIEEKGAFLSVVQPGQEDIFYPQMADAYEDTVKAFYAIRHYLSEAYMTLTEPETEDGSVTFTEAIAGQVQEDLYTVFDTKVAIDGEIMLVKTPLLWSRHMVPRTVSAIHLNRDYWPWFTRELEAKLGEQYDKIPSYFKRHFSYVFALPAEERTAVDNDNYDTKTLTDLIISFMGGTDHALSTSFSYMSARGEKIGPGTYVIVTPTFNNPPSWEELRATICKLDRL